MPNSLTMPHIHSAAKQLQCDAPAVQAVLRVESTGRGFLPDGRPTVLFEGHIFYRQLILRGADVPSLCKAYPSLVYPNWTKAHYSSGTGEWGRLTIARSIHEEAALCAASWGLFQIMGHNHKACGYVTVGAFATAMHIGEEEHLAAFVQFVKANGLAGHLASHNWVAFARAYNGPGYAQNAYHQRLAQAYASYKEQNTP